LRGAKLALFFTP